MTKLTSKYSLALIISVLGLGPSSSLWAQAEPEMTDEDAPVNIVELKEDDADDKWDVAKPPMPTREIPIKVSSGTWMSLDVSPDGKTIVFDLLGDIYRMPISGGAATNIASGLPWEIQPRFSPDGSEIAFISDRDGGDNVWTMNADGSNAKALSTEKFRLMNNPTWSADGHFIAARKHFTTSRSAGTGEVWLYHRQGGSGVALVERSSEAFQKELGEPIFAADGQSIYFSKNVTPGNRFIYAQDSNTDLFNILRYDMQTAETSTVVSGEGGAVRPTPSPDGKSIAFVRRERTRSMLYVKDLASGKEQRLYSELDQDMQETWGVTGMYPNMDWTPDNRSIVFWAKGGIHRIDVTTGKVQVIPFSIDDTREVIDPPRPSIEVAPDTFISKMPRFAQISPDGSRVVFESLGKLWIKRVGSEKASRLSKDNSAKRELFPSWSADGKRLVFVTWSDQELAQIYTVSASGGSLKQQTRQPGHYRRPRFSNDGKMIVFESGNSSSLLSKQWSESAGIYRIALNNRQAVKVSDSGRYPHFSSDGSRVYFTRSGETVDLVSVNSNGHDERVHATSKLVAQYQVSPNDSHLAFHENYDVHVTPMLPGPQAIAAGRDAKALPQVEVSGNGSSYMHWSAGGKQINWSLASTLYSAKLADMHPVTAVDDESADEAMFMPPEQGIDLAMSISSDKPKQLLALVNVRIVSMTDETGGVIENGSILVEDNRIKAIGADITIPAKAKVVDLQGKTITPGFIDAHAHGPQGSDDIIPQQNWSAIAHLALGVTTVHDPSSQASHIFSAAEYQRAGLQLAPRTYSTGEVVYGAKAPGFYASIENYEDARQHVNRLAEQGAHSIKNYNQPRRDQRQQVVAAAHEANIAVVAEGGSNYHMDMAMVADGNTSIEHNLPQAMLYEDVLSMYSQTKVAYTPTLVVTYGGLAADPYWRQATNVWQHPILSKHVPTKLLNASSVRRVTAPEEDFVDGVSAKTAHMLKQRGVLVSIGAHGQQQGLAAHWEMWSFAKGGFSAVEALATATTAPAAHLGFDKDLGSLEVGKLADLVIMNANPLDDIRNSDNIDMVMLNGRLYQAETMNEVHSADVKRASYYWE